MKEFLDTLYKVCASRNSDGMDMLYDMLPILLGQRQFKEANDLLVEMDLARLNTFIMFATVNMTSDYRFQLPYWQEFYWRCREEFARRGRSEREIKDLFDRYKEPDPQRLYNPDAIPYRSPEEKLGDKILDKIALAKKLGDKDLEDILGYYQAERLRYTEREEKFRQLVKNCGRDTIRTECIKHLRQVADTLEKSAGGWPDVYYCSLPENPLLKKTFIDGIEVVISYPWPG